MPSWFKRGDDAFLIDASGVALSPIQVVGDLVVHLSAGQDDVGIEGWVAVGGRVGITTGLHDDQVEFSGQVLVDSDLTVELGQGADQVGFARTAVI